jgi:multiple antibiotic resistance protein
MDFQFFLKAFIPIFFAIDAIGIVPLFLAHTDTMMVDTRNRVVNLAALTALAVGVVFLFVGKELFKFLGIQIYDFKIAGGLLLLIFSVQDLLFSDPSKRRTAGDDPNIGVVPIGLPLIVGPGVLTSLLLSVDINGYTPTLAAFIVNIIIVWITFRYATKIISITGRGGAIAVGKVFSLLLGAIAVAMIRSGILGIYEQLQLPK